MKVFSGLFLSFFLTSLCQVSAFIPSTTSSKSFTRFHQLKKSTPIKRYTRSQGKVNALVDPNDVFHHVEWLTTAVQGIADSDIVQTQAPNYSGWLGGASKLIEGGIDGLHSILNTFGINNSYGYSIIIFTMLIKVVTFPLNYKQIESTTKMQMIAPKLKEIQKKYANDPQEQQQLITKLYADNNVNPLAGCFPALIQIPVFIALYRSLTNLAILNKLDEPFLFLPSLEGPIYGASPTEGMNWLKTGWVDGAPPLGWHDTLAFLSIPVILTVSQVISQQLMQPKEQPEGDAAQQSQAILKFLPFMVGYFALNVPSGLGIYWITNNIVTTLTTLGIRYSLESKSTTSSEVDSTSAAEASLFIDETDQKTMRKGRGVGFVDKPVKPRPKDNIEADEEMIITEDGNETRIGEDKVKVVKNTKGVRVTREEEGQNKVTRIVIQPDELKRRSAAEKSGIEIPDDEDIDVEHTSITTNDEQMLDNNSEESAESEVVKKRVRKSKKNKK